LTLGTPITPVVLATGLSRIYSSGGGVVRALDGVDLRVEVGQIVFVLGPSGSGKSTLMHLIGALDRPTGGTLEVAGVELRSLSDREASTFRGETVGFVFQSHHLLPGMSALDNVLVPLVPRGIQDADRARASQLLDDLGLGDRTHHRPGTLSGGECQRVAIARALVRNPRLLLADEPTGELDSTNGQKVIQILREFVAQEGRAAIIVTHDSRLVQDGDRVCEMQDGRLVDAS
jgi:ABC-type lipoprotein export system ATPase subunit